MVEQIALVIGQAEVGRSRGRGVPEAWDHGADVLPQDEEVWRYGVAELRKLRHQLEASNTYGYRKIHEDIVEIFDEPCCLETVRRIMKSKRLRSTRGRRFVVTTYSNHTMPVAKNALSRDFEADTPNQKWVADITYIPTHQGWTYLATVMDLYARRIVGWATSTRIDTALVSEACIKPSKNDNPEKGYCTIPTAAPNTPPKSTEKR